ncbi:hypothetical protein [Brachyspira hampsonii]|uniref:hypothetical protein n=1 Tax=Brachyspira hampsonii TaxID=1287055 RepID=UPI000A78B997|nr:hypothetical protein [Brachyspira hampsonii]
MAELEKFSALYGKIDYPADLLTIPFEVLEYSDRLGLSASEFKFVCWIFHLTNKDFEKISDCNMTSKKTSFCRQRKSLQAKGYLKIKIARTYQKGKLISSGLVYDFTNLKNKIEELKEEDKKLQNLEATVTVIYDEPSLFNEDVDESSIYPAKLLTDDEEIKELQLQNEFLEKFNKLHKELVNFRIDYIKSALYKKHLLDAFSNRKNNNIDEVLNSVKKSFFRLPIEERKSLRLQDLTKYALLETQEKNKVIQTKKIKLRARIQKSIQYQAELIN